MTPVLAELVRVERHAATPGGWKRLGASHLSAGNLSHGVSHNVRTRARRFRPA